MTSPSTSKTPADAGKSADKTAEQKSGGEVATTNTDLLTSQGTTTIADTVVEKIVGIAARETRGIHDLGGAASRALGAVRERIPGAQRSLAQGVTVEVGERQAAVDLDIIVDYGVPIGELTKTLRRNVITAIEKMTALEVTEVNIAVNDVYLPGDDDDKGDATARVQ